MGYDRKGSLCYCLGPNQAKRNYFFQFQLFYCNPKTITIMQHNYISEKSGNNGKPKRDADPAN